MKNISNIIRCTMLLAMLAVGGNAWADYYLIGSGCMGLGNATGTEMTNGSYTFEATCEGSQWFHVMSAADANNDYSKHYYVVDYDKNDLSIGQSYALASNSNRSHDDLCNLKFSLTNGNTYTISISNGTITITDGTPTSYGVNISMNNNSYGTLDISSASVRDGNYVDVTVTPTAGYEPATPSYTVSSGTATVSYRGDNVFRITPSANCSVQINYQIMSFTIDATPTSASPVSGCYVSPAAQNVNYGGNLNFDCNLASGYIIDQVNTHFGGAGALSYSGNRITISNITSEGTLSVAFKSSVDYTPVVNFGDIPKKTVNSIEVNAYVAELSCKTVTAAGFYWGTSIAEAEEHSNSRHFAASTPATIGSLVKGGTFSKDGIDLFNGGAGPITTGTNIFFQAYVTTSGGGGTGYSDVVGFFYNPCQGLSEVSLTPTAVTLAEGYSVELSVVARSAGKSPTYEWYLDKTEDQMAGTPEAIPGADKDTYTFTLNDNNSHNIRVKVTDNTCGTSSWTHDAAGTYNGIVTSAQAVISTAANCKEPEPSDINFVTGSALAAPYQSIHLSVTDNGSSSYDKFKWEVSEGGILSGTSITDAYFRAPESLTKYTITYTAINSHCTNADVSVKKTVEIKVEKPEDGCNNPGE